tara:strand:+ start:4751 stop:9124 length:4374 start_codon:yes stop_codon:yes gene_type:complete
MANLLSRQCNNTSGANRRKATYSFWIKRHDLQYTTAAQYFLGHRNAESSVTTQRFDFRFRENKLWAISTTSYIFTTDSIFSDTTAWFHLVVAIDQDQSSTNDKYKVYVNGNLLSTANFTNKGLTSGDLGFGGANELITIGYSSWDDAGSGDVNYSIAQSIYVNGLQLPATTFGQTSGGTWTYKRPVDIRTAVAAAGGFGTNGYFLKMDPSVESYGSTHNFAQYPWKRGYNMLCYNRKSDSSANDGYITSKIQPESNDVKYSGSALYCPSAFGEELNGSAGGGMNRLNSETGLINGSDQGLTVLAAASSWTIEAWIKKSDRRYNSYDGAGVWFNINKADGTNRLLLRENNGMSNGWDTYVQPPTGTSGAIQDSTHSAYNHDWEHFALVWDGTNYKYFQNGKYIGVIANSDNAIEDDSVMALFNESDNATGGYNNSSAGVMIDSLRIVSGQTLYTTSSTTVGAQIFTPGDITDPANFTVNGGSSTASITGTVTHLLSLPQSMMGELLNDKGTIASGIDANWRPRWVAVSETGDSYPRLIGDSKWGKSSIAFGEALEYAGTYSGGSYTKTSGKQGVLVEDRVGFAGSTQGAQFENVCNGDFTIEFWFKSYMSISSGGYPRIFDLCGGNNRNSFQIICAVDSTNDASSYNAKRGVPFLWMGGSSEFPIAGNTGSYSAPDAIDGDGKWHHYAITRSGNDWYQFLDGNLFKHNNNPSISSAATTSLNVRANYPTTIGCTTTSISTAFTDTAFQAANFQGAIDQFRCVNNQCLYTSNFTPGNIGSKTTYTTTGSNSLNITGQVVSLLDPDVEVVGTDMSTSDTVSNNGFNDYNFLPGNATSKDIPDNNFCQLSAVGASEQTGQVYSILSHASGFSGGWPNSSKCSAVGNIGVTKGKWYFEVIDGQNNIGDWVGASGGLGIGWATTDFRKVGSLDIGFEQSWNPYSASVGARIGFDGTNDRFAANNQQFDTPTNTGIAILSKNDSLTQDPQSGRNSNKICSLKSDTQNVKVMGLAYDFDNGQVTYYVNGHQTFQRSDSSIGRSNQMWAPCIQMETGSSSHDHVQYNFGGSSHQVNRDANYCDENGYGKFMYKPPTGYLALCDKNWQTVHTPPIADGSTKFSALTWTGNGGTGRSFTGLGFKPALLIWKKRTGTSGANVWSDRLRGTSGNSYESVRSNNTNAANDSNYIASFDNDGFTQDTNTTINENGVPLIAWCWRADETFTPTGTGITSASGLRDTDAGFSILRWTGSSNSGGNITHGLSKQPEFVITKRLDDTWNWDIYHEMIGYDGTPTSTANTLIFTTATPRSVSYPAPDSTNINLLHNFTNANSAEMIAYCWHSVPGYSSFGRYLSNAGDGTIGSGNEPSDFIYLGFKPAFVLIKAIGAANDWSIRDKFRSPQNPRQKVLRWNAEASSQAEQDDAGYAIDFLSTGFKIRTNGSEQHNPNNLFIYAAFADTPSHLAKATN